MSSLAEPRRGLDLMFIFLFYDNGMIEHRCMHRTPAICVMYTKIEEDIQVGKEDKTMSRYP